jgi:hypothetical protein
MENLQGQGLKILLFYIENFMIPLILHTPGNDTKKPIFVYTNYRNMKTVLYALAISMLLVMCGKDKFETKPQLRIKSISPKTVPLNGTIVFRLEFTDKEGDVTDSFLVKKVRLNRRVVPTVLDSFWKNIPDFPKAQKGEIVVTLNYQSIISAINPPNIPGSIPPKKEDDTLVVKFLAQDKAGNKSDTVTTDPIIVVRQ